MMRWLSNELSLDKIDVFINSIYRQDMWEQLLITASNETQTLIEEIGLGPKDLLVFGNFPYSYVFLLGINRDGELFIYKSIISKERELNINETFKLCSNAAMRFITPNTTKISWESLYGNHRK
jgi:hypothetical protein